jgi:hypothetical protein
MNRTQLKGNIDLNLSQILSFDFNSLINIDFQAKNQNELDITEIEILVKEVFSLLNSFCENMELLNKVTTTDLQKLNQSLNSINSSFSNGSYKIQKNIFTLFETLKKDFINSGIYYNLLNPALENLDKINDALNIGNKFLDNKKTFEESIKLFEHALKSKEDYDVNIILAEGEIFKNKANEHKAYINDNTKCFIKNINTTWWLIASLLFAVISLLILYFLVKDLTKLEFLQISLGGVVFKISVIFIPTYLSFYCIKQFSNHRKLYEFYKQKETSVATLSNLYRTYPNNKDLIMEKALNIIFSEMSDKGEIKNSSNEDLISLIKTLIEKGKST